MRTPKYTTPLNSLKSFSNTFLLFAVLMLVPPLVELAMVPKDWPFQSLNCGIYLFASSTTLMCGLALREADRRMAELEEQLTADRSPDSSDE